MPSITVTTTSEFIEHYGRLGMKWYQHRFGEADSRAKYPSKNLEEKTKDIRKVINNLGKDDYKAFTTKNMRYAEIAYDNDKPVAFSYARQYKIDGGLGVVLSVGTDPAHRGKGLSKSLSNKVISDCKDDKAIKEIAWACDSKNKASIATAKSLGFELWYEYSGDSIFILKDEASEKLNKNDEEKEKLANMTHTMYKNKVAKQKEAQHSADILNNFLLTPWNVIKRGVK